jgi:hypothetical protein
MKRVLQILLCVPVLALADDPPPRFTSIRARSAEAQYERSIQQAEAEFQVKQRAAQEVYLQAMGEALDGAMRTRDLAEANRIKGVIDAMNQETNPPSVKQETNSPSVPEVVGTWIWPGGRRISINEDGKLQSRDDAGTWECTDVASRTYVLRWKSGYIDTMVLSSDGNRLKGENNQGGRTTAIRAQQ